MLYAALPQAVPAVEPIFQPGGQLCSRTSQYQDRSNPGCYVTQGGTSTYNAYIPQFPRGQDPNISQTCFVASRSQTLTAYSAANPGYKVADQSGFVYLNTSRTQWPWDIPTQEAYDQLTLQGKWEQGVGDTFRFLGLSRTPPVTHPDIIVDQYGTSEKLIPFFFIVKDRVDYCQSLAAKTIFDEPIHFVFNKQDKTLFLSQVCPQIPSPIREMQANWLDSLIDWRATNPDLAEAFWQITPYNQQDQVAWMIVYIYQYYYNPIAADPQLLPDPTDIALVKLNLGGLSRGSQAQQRLKHLLIPQTITTDTPLPSGFPVTSAADIEALRQKVIAEMKRLGYETAQDCTLPEPQGEFEPGPPAGQGILAQIQTRLADFLANTTGLWFGPNDASLATVFVGRCAPEDWHQVTDAQGNFLNWTCTAQLKAPATVYLLNPEYLKDTCDEFYLGGTGSLKAHFPADLLANPDSDVPPPEAKPLLPFFEVINPGGSVYSPSRSNSDNQVNLPTVCGGEIAQAKGLTLDTKITRPNIFRIPAKTDILTNLYLPKASQTFITTISNSLTQFLRHLLP